VRGTRRLPTPWRRPGGEPKRVPAPQALIVTEADTRLWKNLKTGEPFDEAYLESMRPRQEHRRSARWTFSSGLADASYVATLDDKDRAIVEIIAASEVREDQLVPALDGRRCAGLPGIEAA
jgi:hypothetical protein